MMAAHERTTAGAHRITRRIFYSGLLIGAAFTAFMAINFLHALVRSYADDWSFIEPLDLSAVERRLFAGHIPSVVLQDIVVAPALSNAAFLVWISFFWIPVSLLVTVCVRGDRALLIRLLAFHALLLFASDVVYWLIPARPPWMDTDVLRIIAIQADDGTRIDRNPVAAFPSLHVALPMAYAVWFARGSQPWMPRLRGWMYAWTFAVACAVVYTGEHYVIDVVAGAAWGATLGTLATMLHPARHAAAQATSFMTRARSAVPTPASHGPEIEEAA